MCAHAQCSCSSDACYPKTESGQVCFLSGPVSHGSPGRKGWAAAKQAEESAPEGPTVQLTGTLMALPWVLLLIRSPKYSSLQARTHSQGKSSLKADICVEACVLK